MSDYNFLKSGSGDNINVSDKQEEELTSLLFLFIEKAFKHCAVYVSHAKRNIVQVLDIQTAMKLEAMLFCNNQNTFQEARELLQELNEEEEEDEDENDFFTDEEEEYTKSTCECPLCTVMNDIDNLWNAWEPESPIEIILKRNLINFQI